ncbi:MAG: DUF2243 domain-containing protein [Phormidium sp.]
MNQPNNQLGRFVASGVLLGMGAAAFFDGIVLHQILQWHHMVSSIRPLNTAANIELNTFWDGVFHVGASLLTVAGLILFWQATANSKVPLSLKSFAGSFLIGAGSFDFVEGLINHQFLGIHHVKPGQNQLAWDIGFLTLGLSLAVVGWFLLMKDREEVKT